MQGRAAIPASKILGDANFRRVVMLDWPFERIPQKIETDANFFMRSFDGHTPIDAPIISCLDRGDVAAVVGYCYRQVGGDICWM